MDRYEILKNLSSEFRRGTLTLAVLSCLQTDKYGYALLEELESKAITIDQSTLYPLLRRLETQGILKSKWEIEEAKPRKYYSLSMEGKEIYRILKIEWENLVKNMNQLMEEK
ncbi:MAG: PadR family transcriptional regulator [Bacilli bacterium]|jgi:DNA-binding PadR family transcriptional regulator|nr:PadR family transcriptional regulator [Bacilli bacterium]MDY0064276.1 PadR family transcriptional regulator [Bacilli bacterium]